MPAGSGDQRNTSASASDGVLKPSVCRGRVLSWSAIASKSSWLRSAHRASDRVDGRAARRPARATDRRHRRCDRSTRRADLRAIRPAPRCAEPQASTHRPRPTTDHHPLGDAPRPHHLPGTAATSAGSGRLTKAWRFPVSGHGPVGSFGRTFGDVENVRAKTAPIGLTCPAGRRIARLVRR